jgi:hypothetical protein
LLKEVQSVGEQKSELSVKEWVVLTVVSKLSDVEDDKSVMTLLSAGEARAVRCRLGTSGGLCHITSKINLF